MDRVRDIIRAYDPEYTGGPGVSGGDPYYQDFTDKLDAFVREYPPATGGGASIAEYDFASSSSGDEDIPKRGGDARGVGAGIAASLASPFEELAVAGLMTTAPAPSLAAPSLAAPILAAAAPTLAAGVTLAATVPAEGATLATPLMEGLLI